MQLGFYFDQQRCTGCGTCVVACKQWRYLPAGPASLCRISTIESGKYPRVQVSHLFLSCYHCGNPACVTACPAEAIRKRAADGIVVVDRDLCIPGCRSCLHACPYKAPQFQDENSKMVKCDLCLERFQGGKQPLCVVSCPLRALDTGPMEEIVRKYGGVSHVTGFPNPSRTRPSVIFRARNLLTTPL